ncbi:hypothetical protein [Aminipila sp.]|uniref:hypothetical protein n=1 Tax=Aminipila sp. TaxID=2060095 RepID=UPI00289FB4A8|nr:hypothetical protein [Aminipila sp.]
MALSNLKSIADLFQDSLYRIPDYQRGYAWDEKQLFNGKINRITVPKKEKIKQYLYEII